MNIQTTQRPPVVPRKSTSEGLSSDKTAKTENPKNDATMADIFETGDENLLHEFGRKSFGVAAGATAAFTAAIVYGAAGAAEGFVHGADIPESQRETIRSGVMAGNLAAAGALGGLGGAAVAVTTGLNVWKATSPETKSEIVEKAQSWTDKANDWVNSVWPAPGEDAPLESNSRRAVGGVVGEFAGGSAGIVYGLTKAFSFGQEAGETLVDDVVKLVKNEGPQHAYS